MLSELDGPDRIYRRVRVRLEKLDHELRAWNDASRGSTKACCRTFMAACRESASRFQNKEPARATCVIRS